LRLGWIIIRKGDLIIKSSRRKRLYTLSGTAALAVGLIAFSASNAYAAPQQAALTEQWVTIATYPSLHTCDENGQVYIDEGLASQYQCDASSGGYVLKILTLDG
jgi:hypothetical protein